MAKPEGGPDEYNIIQKTETQFVADTADSQVDALGRSEIAFIMAGHINQIWDEFNSEKRKSDKSRIDSTKWTGFPQQKQSLLPGFVVHVDAPWGGGKTSFANYLRNILNPYRNSDPLPKWMEDLPFTDYNEDDHSQGSWPKKFHRPWHIVEFNAWKYQNVTPPWWVFYQTILKQCSHAISNETNQRKENETPVPPPSQGKYKNWLNRKICWISVWVREYSWRLFTHQFTGWLLLSIGLFVLIGLAYQFDLIAFEIDSTDKSTKNYWFQFPIMGIASLLALANTSKLVAAFSKTLLFGKPEEKNNYGMGTEDPLDRFRQHFVTMTTQMERPILVVVDDLDRCNPEFVVDLIRGMQTILASPRIVFLLLCDRDWIEKAFAVVNKSMNEIDVGPEHSFGGRFVEKAIQLSFILPEPNEEQKQEYLRHVLRVPQADKQLNETEAEKNIIQQFREEVLSVKTFKKWESASGDFWNIQDESLSEANLSEDRLKAIKDKLARELALKSAGDETATHYAGHILLDIQGVLPDNPRQVKRIVSAMVLAQEIYRMRSSENRIGDANWQLLARWIILMIEWPKSWYTLSKFPKLADLLHDENDIKNLNLSLEKANQYIKCLKKSKAVVELLSFNNSYDNWDKNKLNSEAIEWLREILPATSGNLHDISSPSEDKKEAG